MFFSERIEVGSGRGKIGRLTSTDTMNVEGVVPGRELSGFKDNLDPGLVWGEGGRRHHFPLGIPKLCLSGLGLYGSTPDSAQESKRTHKKREESHFPLLYFLYWTIVPLAETVALVEKVA
jgi:hypothetical protein